MPDGSTRENTYGGCGCAGGEVTTVRDERGRRRKLTNDVLGRLKQVDELHWNQTVYATTTYTYDTADRLKQINQGGQLRSFNYDGLGRLQSRTTPEQGTTTYSYFADSTVQTVTDARGATTTFSYNNRNLPTGITYGVPGGVAATPNVTFGYDAAGNRTSMTDGLGSMSYVYDQLSRLTSETRTFTGVGSFALNYGYNLGNEVTSITNPWSAQVGYNYDKTGRPTSISGSGYGGVTSYINSMSYRAFGLKQMSYSNGRTLSLQYDNRLRPTSWSIPGVLRMQYLYEGGNGSKVGFARNQDDETLDRYWAYDHVGRLAVARTGNEARIAIGEQVPLLGNGPYSHTNTHDQWGNITAREGWGGDNAAFGPVTYTNNKRTNLTYDAAGNLINDIGLNYTYDATGQQATASYTGYLLQQYYDGNGVRGKKVDGGATTYYLRSTVLGGQVIAEISSGGALQRGFVYLAGELLAVQQSNAVSWVHQDPFVKSKRVTNGSGTVVSTIELDPWGGNTSRNNNDAFQPQSFTSYTRDANAADDAMFRRYNRWWSRFDQPDPHDGSYDLTNPQSFNRYPYTQNDPVNFTDPTGLMPACGPDSGDVIRICTWAPGISEYLWIINSRFGGFTGGGGGGGAQDPVPQPHPTPTPTPQPGVPSDCVDRAFNEIHRQDRKTDRARTAVTSLLAEAANQGLTAAQAAYVLATAEHESNMGNAMVEDYAFAARQNYVGGPRYRGRGYVHLTHRGNYESWGLAGNPEQAAVPATAARIAVEGMVNGSFTGNNLEGSIPRNGRPDFVNARWIIIGRTAHERQVARRLARNAEDFLAALNACGFGQ